MIASNTAHPIKAWDKAGLVLSAACLVHCLLTPFAVALLPAITHGMVESEWPHIVLACLATPFAGTALIHGFRRHGSLRPVFAAVPGIAMLWVSLAILEPHWLESALASLGAVLVGIGHLLNHRLSCHCCGED